MKKLIFTLFCSALLFTLKAQVFYGITAEGGLNTLGVLYSFDAATGSYAKLYDFDYWEGAYPTSKILLSSDGKIYGLTTSGDATGSIFSFDPNTNVYKKHIDFYFDVPTGGLIELRDRKLYGMKIYGGRMGNGTIFSFDPVTGEYMNIHHFNAPEGALPIGSLMQAKDGKLYGMTRAGGTMELGVLFSFDPVTRQYSKLKDFTGRNGAEPHGDLVQASNGKLYGMTSGGGNNNAGVLFSFDPKGNSFSKIKDFSQLEGALPYGSLIEAKDGRLYGMTSGYPSRTSMIFSLDPNNNEYTVRNTFDFATGSGPFGTLLQASDGLLYGTTRYGGISRSGVLFSFDPNNDAYKKLVDFNGRDGGDPSYDALIEVPCTTSTYYRDVDGDGFGSPEAKVSVCSINPPNGYVKDSTDCDDNDDSSGQASLWYLDSDNDGYSTGTGISKCSTPGLGYRNTGLKSGGDCNDGDADINPDMQEVCGDGIDNNCNGLVDEGCNQTITSFTLVNAATDKDVQELKDGAEINIAALRGTRINIRANVDGTMGSIVMKLSGSQVCNQTENIAPYALFGNGGNNYGSWMPKAGTYTLTVIPYTEANGKGTAGTPVTITFTVVEKLTLSHFSLVNAERNTTITKLRDGDVVDLGH